MKKLVVLSLVVLVLLVGCASGGETAVSPDTPILTVGDGQTQKTYTAADLEGLARAEASFKDVVYTGVPVTALLKDSGFPVSGLKAVKAVASDGYSVNYDLAQIQKDDVIVAYAQADGPLAAEDGTFRMVLPEEEGKLNVRMLVEIQAVP
ncbi:MAG: molybdopterin-dependent oxidoreductase [Ardenticatenaceae bacterium]|nr:molybdopterin-dependent oxidoreductase [Ardenticatenaceae bacterium]MCB9443474.1 molybdopterin-dependent oxidoreductase [Ardenticatenaceae bacterium]